MLKKTLFALALTGLAVSAFAQQPGIKRTPLQLALRGVLARG